MKLRVTARQALAAAALAGTLAALPAQAALVTVSGGFTSFSGPVGEGNVPFVGADTLTFVNGNTVAPQTAIGTIPGQPPEFTQFPEVGNATVNFASPVQAVDFWTSTGATVSTHNLVQFTPAAPQEVAAPGIDFLLGTLTLTNGTFWGGRGNHSFGITVEASGGLGVHTFSDTLIYVITSNVADPALAADAFYFLNHPELGSMRVGEARDGPNTGTVDLYGKIGSLTPTLLDNPTGGVFLSPDIPPPPPTPIPAVPEPATALLFAAGMGALAATRRRRAG